MKRNALLVLGLLVLTAVTVFAQAKPPKASKILDKNVPVGESAIIYVSSPGVVFQCDDEKFGIVGPVSMRNLKGSGGDYSGKIAKPILQIPAGQHTITANLGGDKYYDGRKVTYVFLPGHYYHISAIADYSDGVGGGWGKAVLTGTIGGLDWCFVDITDEVKDGKKSYKEKWEQLAFNGELGKNQVSEKYGNLNSLLEK